MTRVYVSIGSNQERERNVRAAIHELEALFAPVTVSSVYETVAVGFAGDPFFNLVAGFDTDRDLESLLAALQGIETRCGRVRTEIGARRMTVRP